MVYNWRDDLRTRALDTNFRRSNTEAITSLLADSSMSERLKISLVASLASIGLCLGTVCYFWFGDVHASMPTTSRASAGDAEGRTMSADLLTQQRAMAANRTAKPEQRVEAIQQLALARDWDATETLLDLLDDPSALIRGKSAVALRAILGTDFYFHADDPPARRLQVISGMRRYWQSRQLHPPTK